MPTIRIRKAPRSLYQSVREISDDLLREGENNTSVFRPSGEYWVAEDIETKKLVAYAGLVRSVRYSDVVYFHASGVVPEARGHHLQRRLIRARLHWAKDHGFSWAVTDTCPDNVASARSLIACGFKPYWPLTRWKESGACYWSRGLCEGGR